MRATGDDVTGSIRGRRGEEEVVDRETAGGKMGRAVSPVGEVIRGEETARRTEVEAERRENGIEMADGNRGGSAGG